MREKMREKEEKARKQREDLLAQKAAEAKAKRVAPAAAASAARPTTATPAKAEPAASSTPSRPATATTARVATTTAKTCDSFVVCLSCNNLDTGLRKLRHLLAQRGMPSLTICPILIHPGPLPRRRLAARVPCLDPHLHLLRKWLRRRLLKQHPPKPLRKSTALRAHILALRKTIWPKRERALILAFKTLLAMQRLFAAPQMTPSMYCTH